MTFTLTTSGAIIEKAGANVSSTAVASGGLMLSVATQAEGDINAKTRYDWVTNYADVGTNFQGILTSACSAWAATKLINYDMSGYTSRQEAVTMMNTLWTEYKEAIKALEDAEVRRGMGA